MSRRSPPIAALVPHQGAMQLLDAVIAWDQRHAVCRAISHRDPSNPLRMDGRLSALAGIEYAGQAMAVHGALLGVPGSAPPEGFLAALRGVVLADTDLDALGPVLTVRVDRIAGDAGGLMYRFAVGSGDDVAASGRLTVVLAQGTAQGPSSG